MRIGMSARAVAVASLLCAPAAARDGQHDFDFDFGTWQMHMKRLEHPLSGSTSWYEMEGTTTNTKILGGRGNIAVVEGDGPHGHLELLSLRLYDPNAHQWSIRFATSGVGVLDSVPGVGEFHDGKGEFLDQESYNGRIIFVRFRIWSTGPDSAHSEQAFSADYGRTWETNWVNDYVRIPDDQAQQGPSLPADASHDFDFHFGTWKTHVSRILEPLSGSTKWAQYDGTSLVRPLWNGRASLFELGVEGPEGRIEGAGLRLYDPKAHQWSLNWVSGRNGTLGPPTIGEFQNGKGVFFDQEDFNGRTILVRNTFSDITPNSSRFEQAFSADNGASWETNWIMTFERSAR